MVPVSAESGFSGPVGEQFAAPGFIVEQLAQEAGDFALARAGVKNSTKYCHWKSDGPGSAAALTACHVRRVWLEPPFFDACEFPVCYLRVNSPQEDAVLPEGRKIPSGDIIFIVLASHNVPPWRVLAWVKSIEAVMQLRPRSLWRLFAHPDKEIRKAMGWYYRIGRKVWFYEVWSFLFRGGLRKNGPTLEELWGEPQDREVYALRRSCKEDEAVYLAREELIKEERQAA